MPGRARPKLLNFISVLNLFAARALSLYPRPFASPARTFYVASFSGDDVGMFNANFSFSAFQIFSISNSLSSSDSSFSQKMSRLSLSRLVSSS